MTHVPAPEKRGQLRKWGSLSPVTLCRTWGCHPTEPRAKSFAGPSWELSISVHCLAFPNVHVGWTHNPGLSVVFGERTHGLLGPAGSHWCALGALHPSLESTTVSPELRPLDWAHRTWGKLPPASQQGPACLSWSLGHFHWGLSGLSKLDTFTHTLTYTPSGHMGWLVSPLRSL